MAVDRPIIFSAPMVRALLAGTKTQTRRLLTPQPQRFEVAPGEMCDMTLHYGEGEPWPRIALGRVIKRQEVRYRPGMKLWVREAVRADEHPEEDEIGVRYLADDAYHPLPATDEAQARHFVLRCYRSKDPDLDAYKDVPPIHMPRWASRLTLTVTDVRVQSLQEISLADELAEGAPIDPDYRDTTADGSGLPMVKIGLASWATPRCWYHQLWDSLHKPPHDWDANPEIVAVSFTVERRNIDAR